MDEAERNVCAESRGKESGMVSQGDVKQAAEENWQGAGQNAQRMEPDQQRAGQNAQRIEPNQQEAGQNAQGIEPDRRAAEPGGLSAGETEETKRFRENYGFFAPASFLYAVFYVLCMFRNGSGITFPFFVGGSLLFLCLSLSKLGLILKRGSIFYMAAMMLLGVSTFCTDDGRLLFFNKLGIFLLMMSLLLKQFYKTAGWKLGKYLGSICVLAFASLGELGRPFSDGTAYRKSGAGRLDKRFWYAGLGLLTGLPLMLVVLLLLAGADAVFRQMTSRLLEAVNLYNIFAVLVRIAAVFFAAYALTAYLCRRRISEAVPDRRRGEPVLAVTVTGLLTMLYLLFSGIQVAGLFLGKLRLPQGYTYAMYAREGFFQLLAVSLLNLVIVLVCLSFFRESRVLKGILMVMSLCTFVMIASSAMRMVVYIRYYYLTFLRILVLWALVLLAALFAGVVINIFREKFPLFGYSAGVVTVLYLALSFAHPDYIIARVNVANAPHGNVVWQREKPVPEALEGELRETAVLGGTVQGEAVQGESVPEEAEGSRTEVFEGTFFLAEVPFQDYSYLSRLCADAAPVLVPYLRELGYETGAFYAENAVIYAEDREIGDAVGREGGFGYYWMRRMQKRAADFGLRSFNVSRYVMLKEFGKN